MMFLRVTIRKDMHGSEKKNQCELSSLLVLVEVIVLNIWKLVIVWGGDHSVGGD